MIGRRLPSLRAVLKASPDAVIVVGSQEKIVYATENALRMFGYRKLVGRQLSELLPERSRPIHSIHTTVYALDPQVRQMGPDREVWAQREDGSEFRCEVGLAPLGRLRTAAVIRALPDARPGPLNPPPVEPT